MADRALLPNQTAPPNMEWRTPRSFFDLVNREFGFSIDAAADHYNALCEFYYTEDGLFRQGEAVPRVAGTDGLTGPWHGYALGGVSISTWCNPPYGRELPKWAAKARGESFRRDNGVTSVLLIPPARNTWWWFNHVEGRAAEVRYLIGRIQFDAPPGRETKDSNRYDSALVIYRPGYEERGAGTHSWSWDWRRELA